MNPKTLQYSMGHSDIGVTMNVYTHFGLDDAAEIDRLNKVEKISEELEPKEKVTQKIFRVV